MINMDTFYFKIDLNKTEVHILPFVLSHDELRSVIRNISNKNRIKILKSAVILLQQALADFKGKSDIYLGNGYERTIDTADKVMQVLLEADEEEGMFQEDYLTSISFCNLRSLIEESRDLLKVLDCLESAQRNQI